MGTLKNAKDRALREGGNSRKSRYSVVEMPSRQQLFGWFFSRCVGYSFYTHILRKTSEPEAEPADACALVYQVVWARLFNEIFGSTLFAVSAVLAAFKSGKPEAAAEQLRVLEALDPEYE